MNYIMILGAAVAAVGAILGNNTLTLTGLFVIFAAIVVTS